MATQSRAELFAQAKKKREEQKAREANRGTGWNSSESSSNIEYVALQTEGERVIRLTGLPLSMRESGMDATKVEIATILGDDGKRFRAIFPDHETHKSYLLWKIYDLVTSGTWKEINGRRVKNYIYEALHPECFKRVMYNDNPENKYEKGWKPSAYVLLNCIDRSDPEWHKEHKHTKVLSKRASENKETGSFFYDPGIPELCYNQIYDDVVSYYGDWEDYDIVVKKLNVMPYYSAKHGVIESQKISEPSKAIVVEGPLTDEEKAYEKYDFNELFPVTSYRRIKEKLGDFIRKVDIDFKKNFTEELNRLVEEEQKRWASEGRNEYGYRVDKTQVTNSAEDISNIREQAVSESDMVPPAESEVKEEPAVRSRVNVAKAQTIDWDALADGSYNGKKYLGVPFMTEEEKNFVLSVREDGSFEYKKVQGVSILLNDLSGFKSPEFFHVDPLSGDTFVE